MIFLISAYGKVFDRYKWLKLCLRVFSSTPTWIIYVIMLFSSEKEESLIPLVAAQYTVVCDKSCFD